MLVISNYKKGDVITIKLSTGEEVVARFDSDNDNEVKIVKPTVLTLNPQDGTVMLVAWLMSIDTMTSDAVNIYKSQIVAISKPHKGISDGYLHSTTGIARASTMESSLLI
jgi:hypothetical protein|tara:strand:- start:4838 stop:5167 length:330 start_codon:yes stop_codon:yes gene_type:complete